MIYSSLIDSLGRKNAALLQTTTSGPNFGGDLTGSYARFGFAKLQTALGVSDTLLKNLREQNARRVPVDSAWFPVGRVRVVSAFDAQRLDSLGYAVWQISMPAVSSDSSVAIVYAGWNKGFLNQPASFGYGSVYRLDRDSTGYRVVRSALVWVR
jgi:hypothetical protein